MTLAGRVTSEGDLIQRYLAPLASTNAGAFGLRDDAALLDIAQPMVMTMDAIAEGVHFLPGDPAADIGWKAVAVNVSDLIAKGATPRAYLMALSFPEAPTHDWMADFARGLGEAQSAFGVTLIGGDTDRRPGPITITITAIGAAASGQSTGRHMVGRGTARPGLLLYVTGTLGDAALGLVVRRREPRAAGWGLDAAQRAFLEASYLRPRPPLALAPLLVDYAAAAMDLSDGLAKDLGRMAAASGVSAVVDLPRLPLSEPVTRALASDASVTSAIVVGGDDYQVLFAISQEHTADFEAAARVCGVRLSCIGATGSGAGVTIRDDTGRAVAFGATGYDHF